MPDDLSTSLISSIAVERAVHTDPRLDAGASVDALRIRIRAEYISSRGLDTARLGDRPRGPYRGSRGRPAASSPRAASPCIPASRRRRRSSSQRFSSSSIARARRSLAAVGLLVRGRRSSRIGSRRLRSSRSMARFRSWTRAAPQSRPRPGVLRKSPVPAGGSLTARSMVDLSRSRADANRSHRALREAVLQAAYAEGGLRTTPAVLERRMRRIGHSRRRDRYRAQFETEYTWSLSAGMTLPHPHGLRY